MLLVLLLLAGMLPVCTGLEPSYGVLENLLEHYAAVKPDEPFVCLCGNASVMGWQVNDDYCDCPDGSDEPGTSACTAHEMIKLPPDWKFGCKNDGFKPQEIPHNRINDGLCDCCDGSDEYSGNTICPNVCAETQEAEEKKRLEEERIKQAGIFEKEKMLAQVVINRENDKALLEKESMELEKLKGDVYETSVKLHPLEEKEKEEKQRLLDAYNVAYEAWKEEKKNNKTTESNTRANLTMSCIRWDARDLCGDEEESSAPDDKGCNDLIPPTESGFCVCSSNETDSETLIEKKCDHEPLNCSFVCATEGGTAGNNGEFEDERFDMDDGSLFELPEARDLRRELNEFNQKINQLSSSVDELQKRLNRNINTEDVIRTLKDECFTLDIKSYTYELCLFKDVHQYDKGTKNGPSMGIWGRFGDNTYSLWSSTSDYTHMIFENGARCWNGNVRKTDVHVVCGLENKLTQVEEPSMCTYSMVFQTPAVCE